ncbi:HD-GYP domain-containing protein [Moritella sp. Urea-trap-13]|uniref:HD-GYP domain-containing protein n=1 Tax=Moritella sp. Urea-trap-13 TaxID=2058327 RepID=UPI000C34F4AB|nr:HD domain-containing phosphohydrolase [Moritella sp. Urea-trap-13]PKH07843.1 response regulator [Moritella sp. Urea-trap-13]
MLNYNEINKIFNRSEDTSTYLDALYNAASNSYLGLSRLSIILIKDDQASNYFIRDRLATDCNHDIFVTKINENSDILGMIKAKSARVVDDITSLTLNSRTLHLWNNGHRSSFSYPLISKGKTIAMVFFNASELAFFSKRSIQKDMLFLSSLIHSLIVRQFENKYFVDVALAVALDIGHAKDPETKEHLNRMERYSSKLAYLLSDNEEITHEFIHRIESYATFHDIGKYKVPDNILFSNTIYTPEEREVMNLHCTHGIDIINNVLKHFPMNMHNSVEFRFLKNIILHHHEHFDGNGYPMGLKGYAIPLEARIVMVADVFDALLSKRLYKPAWTIDHAATYMKDNSGTMFDPDCVQVLLDNLPDFIEIYETNLD